MPDRYQTTTKPEADSRRHRDRHRPNAATRRWYSLDRWERLRDRVLRESAYTCAECGHITLALDVDHIRRHNGDPRLFWDRSNLQALCHSPCHERKTQRGE